MSYIRNSMSERERLIYLAQFHWSYTAGAFLWVGLAFLGLWFCIEQAPAALGQFMTAGVIAPLGRFGQLNYLIGGALALFGLWRYAKLMAIKFATEIGVTNERIIYKRGVLSRRVESLDVDRIEGTELEQGPLGRMLGYGRVVIRGTGTGGIRFPPIADPTGLRRAITDAASGPVWLS